MSVSLEEAKSRFAEAGITRSDRYVAGTQGKGSVWAGSKARAKANFIPAMQEALSKGSYEKGLDSAQATDYERGVADKGVNNWPVGMQASSDKFATKIGKFVPLWSQSLPTAKGNRRSAANIKRMTENVTRFVTAAGK